MNSKSLSITYLAFVILFSSVFSHVANSKPFSIVYLNSYHKGYQWTDKCFDAFKLYLKTPASIHHIYMDTKINQDIEHKNKITKEVLAFIKKHNPDLIVAAEDNASAYIIEPYFKNHKTPVIFMGVNNQPSNYGYPYNNVTGIVEMDGIVNLINAIRIFDSKKMVGMIFSTTNTSKRVLQYVEKQNLKDVDTFQVIDAQQWYEKMLEVNQTHDFIAIDTITGIKGLDHKSARDFIEKNIDIPILSGSGTSRHLTHMGYINLPQEHGSWVAKQTDSILNGASPSDIPIHYSHQYVMFFNDELISKTKPDISKKLYTIPHTSLNLLERTFSN